MGSTDKTPLGINLLSIGLPVEPSLLSGSIPILFYYQHHCLPPDSSSDSATKPKAADFFTPSLAGMNAKASSGLKAVLLRRVGAGCWQ
ncbi:hypothetical protein CapIbe_017674 [Capra ibex]